ALAADPETLVVLVNHRPFGSPADHTFQSLVRFELGRTASATRLDLLLNDEQSVARVVENRMKRPGPLLAVADAKTHSVALYSIDDQAKLAPMNRMLVLDDEVLIDAIALPNSTVFITNRRVVESSERGSTIEHRSLVGDRVFLSSAWRSKGSCPLLVVSSSTTDGNALLESICLGDPDQSSSSPLPQSLHQSLATTIRVLKDNPSFAAVFGLDENSGAWAVLCSTVSGFCSEQSIDRRSELVSESTLPLPVVLKDEDTVIFLDARPRHASLVEHGWSNKQESRKNILSLDSPDPKSLVDAVSATSLVLIDDVPVALVEFLDVFPANEDGEMVLKQRVGIGILGDR
ncbi:MAG: hypothetical protein AAFY44_18130, partial [Pseudomonadota bacterium]